MLGAGGGSAAGKGKRKLAAEVEDSTVLDLTDVLLVGFHKLPVDYVIIPSNLLIGITKARKTDETKVKEIAASITSRGNQSFGADPLIVALTPKIPAHQDLQHARSVLQALCAKYANTAPRLVLCFKRIMVNNLVMLVMVSNVSNVNNG